MESVILEEDIDENYEPTQAEIDEYAAWLGMKRPEDDDLLWIASEGLKAPLPEHWKPCKTQDGEIYYFNFATGESVWSHPCDEYYQKTYEEEKAKKMRRKVDSQQKRAAAPSAAKASAGPVTLGRQPAGGPIGMAALTAAKLGPIGGGAALAPIGSSSGSLNASLQSLHSYGSRSREDKQPAVKSPNESPSKSGKGPPASSSQKDSSGRLPDSEIESISKEAAESRAKLMELAARVESELEQERDAALEDTRTQVAAEGKADDARIRSAQREAALGSVVEAGEQLKAQVLAHAEATLAAERVAVAARRRAIMEKDLATEIAELNAAKTEMVQGAAAAAAAKRMQEAEMEATAAFAAREVEIVAKEKAAEAALEKARGEAEALLKSANERVAQAEAVASAAERAKTAKETEAEEARAAAEKIKSEANMAAMKLTQEAKAAAEKVKYDAEAAAEAVRSAALSEAAKAGSSAATESARVRAEAEAEAADILRKAREEAEAMRKDAQLAEEKVASAEAAATERDKATAEAARAKREAAQAAAEIEKARQEAQRIRSDAAAEAERLRQSAEEEIERRIESATEAAAAEVKAEMRAEMARAEQAAASGDAAEIARLRTEIQRLQEELAASIQASEAAAADSARAAREAAEEAVASARVNAEAAARRAMSEAETEAEAIRQSARKDADRLLSEARIEAETIRSEAEGEGTRARLAREAADARSHHETGSSRSEVEVAATAILEAARVDAARIRKAAEEEAEELKRAAALASARATAAARSALAMSSRAADGGEPEQDDESERAGVVVKSLADLAGEPLVVSSCSGNAAPEKAGVIRSSKHLEGPMDQGGEEKENAGATSRAIEIEDTEIAAMLRAQRRQVLSERSRLKQARSLLNQQSRNIRQRQDHVLATQREWKADMRRINELCDGEQRESLLALMRQVRLSLERQATQLNEETDHVQQHSAWVREWEASLQQLDASYKEMLVVSESSEDNFAMKRKHGLHDGHAWQAKAKLERQGGSYDELRVELARIAKDLSALVSTPGVPYVPHPPNAFFARRLYEQAALPSANGVLDYNLKLKSAMPAYGGVTGSPIGTAWLAQRERVQSLMQSHARWLRKLRDQVAFA